ncbi:hypothetical protein [Maribacter sp. R86514]|uniref:hypothetical protein n=1 Tax=Maribacter sp. R86514 TaxID=3093854 RepID=UPI0037C70231
MKKVFLIFAFLLCCASSLTAQKASSDITNKFFEIFENDALQAIDYAFATNPYLESEKLAIETLKNKYKKAISQTGTYLGFEKITEKDIVDRYKVCSFLLRYEKMPIRFTFIMYRAKETWCVNQLYYDSSMQLELEASAKQDRL